MLALLTWALNTTVHIFCQAYLTCYAYWISWLATLDVDILVRCRARDLDAQMCMVGLQTTPLIVEFTIV